MIVEPYRPISFAVNSKGVKAVWTILSIFGFVITILNAKDIPEYNKTGHEIKELTQRRLPALTSALGTIFGCFTRPLYMFLILVWVLGPFFWYVCLL